MLSRKFRSVDVPRRLYLLFAVRFKQYGLHNSFYDYAINARRCGFFVLLYNDAVIDRGIRRGDVFYRRTPYKKTRRTEIQQQRRSLYSHNFRACCNYAYALCETGAFLDADRSDLSFDDIGSIYLFDAFGGFYEPEQITARRREQNFTAVTA